MPFLFFFSTFFLLAQHAYYGIAVKNIHFFATLIDHVAKELNVPVGEYTHFITNVCLDRGATSC